MPVWLDTVGSKFDTVSRKVDTVPNFEPTVSSQTGTVQLDTNYNHRDNKNNISNIRKATHHKNTSGRPTQANREEVGQTVSHQNASDSTIRQVTPHSPNGKTTASALGESVPIRLPQEGLAPIASALKQRAGTVASHNQDASEPATLPRRRGRPTAAEAEARQAILAYIEDFAREFNDQAKLKASTTRAVNLFRQSGVELGAFTSLLHEARAITKERTASIRARVDTGTGGWSTKNKMAYLFAVLEDLLGLKEKREIAAPEPPTEEQSYRRWGQPPPRR